MKFVYGLGEWGASSFAAIMGFYLNPFFLEVAGVPAGLAGTILLVAKLVDAVTDPLIGIASDRTRSRFGRRKIWIAVFVIPLAAFYVAVWLVPNTSSDGAKVAYYMTILIFLSCTLSCVHLPYSSLAPELTENYDERTSLMVFKVGVFSIATIATTFAHSMIIEAFSSFVPYSTINGTDPCVQLNVSSVTRAMDVNITETTYTEVINYQVRLFLLFVLFFSLIDVSWVIWFPGSCGEFFLSFHIPCCCFSFPRRTLFVAENLSSEGMAR